MGATANNLLGKQYSRILAFEQLIEVVNTIHLRDNAQVADRLPDTDLLPTGQTVRSHFGLDETPVSADEPEAEAAPEPEVTRNTIIMSVRLYEKLREEVSISGQQAAMFVYRSIDEDRDRANITLEGNFEFPIGNFFDLRDGNISYCPANRRQQFTDSGAWSRDGRQVIKTGKFVQELIERDVMYLQSGDTVIDSVNDTTKPIVTRFCELKAGAVRATASEDVIQISNDPSSIYQMATAEGTGSLGSSCMRPNSGHTCRHGAPFYSRIEGLKIAYTVNARNQLTGRALIWDDCSFINEDNEVETEGTFKFMDRIYGSEQTIANFKQWAKDNGYWHKAEQNSSNRVLVSPQGYSVSLNYRYNNKVTRLYDYCPYMDTLSYLDIEAPYPQTTSLTGSYIRMQSTAADQFDSRVICPACGAIAQRVRNMGCDICSVQDMITGNYINKRAAVQAYRDGNTGFTLPSNIIGWVEVRVGSRLLFMQPQRIMTAEGAVAYSRDLVQVAVVEGVQ